MLLSEPDPDALLIQELMDTGNDQLFRSLVDKYYQSIYNYCFRFFGVQEDAEDCTQEVFVKVHTHVKKFQFRSKFYSWIYRIAINTCNEMARSKSYRNQMKGVSLTEGAPEVIGNQIASVVSDPDPQLILQRKEINIAFQNALCSLKDIHRTLIILKDVEGRSYEEIAQCTGLRLGTVRSSLARARYRMAGLLSDHRHEL